MDYTDAYRCPGLLVVPGEPCTIEQALSVLLGHADACQRRADRYRDMSRRAITRPTRLEAEHFGAINAAKADSLRFAVDRIRDLTQCGDVEGAGAPEGH